MWSNIKDILKYTFSSVVCLVALVIFFFIFEFDFWTSIGLTIGLGVFLYYVQNGGRMQGSRKTQKQRGTLGKVSPEKEAFYHSKGLTKEQIAYFRNTMDQAKTTIQDIEANLQQRSKLKAIAARNDTVDILKDFFKNIVNQPNRLHEVDKFLYTNLPSLKELTEKYITIDGHVSKTKETYTALDKCAKTIDDMCRHIGEDYVRFMSNDIEDMDIELELAKQVLKRDNEGKSNANALDEEL
nr:5-bromo-4-chloroindolyl phosphate hydrolysis family protein [uncultured Trichococcus sp.]